MSIPCFTLLGDWGVSRDRKGLTKDAPRERVVVPACSDARVRDLQRSSELDGMMLRWEVSDWRQLSCPTTMASSLFTCSELSSSLELQDIKTNMKTKNGLLAVLIYSVCVHTAEQF